MYDDLPGTPSFAGCTLLLPMISRAVQAPPLQRHLLGAMEFPTHKLRTGQLRIMKEIATEQRS